MTPGRVGRAGGAARRGDDPRTLITPDAFQVASHLLGLPTAPPWRRLLAMLVDLALIALLANAPAFLLALAVALVLLRVALGRGADASRRRLRGALGCLGVAALVVGAGAVWMGRSGGPRIEIPDGSAGGGTVSLRLGDVPRVMSALTALQEAPTDSAARAAADGLVALALERGVEPVRLRQLLAEELAAEAEGGERARAALASAIDAAVAAAEGAPGREGDGTPDSVPAGADDSLFAAWRSALAAGDTAAAERARRALASGIAAPELAQRERRIADLRREVKTLEGRAGALREELEEAERGPGLLRVLRAVADDLGLGLGWSGLYFTVFLVLWKGRTPGKRLMRIRVLKLDGLPIGWWNAFERFGGYAASIFTGLLGFAELLWDRNRQALHDRIARTVVVREAGATARAAPPAAIAG